MGNHAPVELVSQQAEPLRFSVRGFAAHFFCHREVAAMSKPEEKPDYEKMYYALMHASEQALELLERMKRILVKAELDAEEIYIGESN